MTQSTPPNVAHLQAEVNQLRDELQTRDQLVQQLSQELFRLVKDNTSFTPAPEVSERHQAEVRSLRDQLKGVEEQVQFYQGQISSRDQEVERLRHLVKGLTHRSKTLEKVIQEMPRIYKEKFSERMVPIKEKVARIQRENRQLHAELQSVSYRLAVRSRRTNHLDLPSFPQLGTLQSSLPALGDV
ncbi:MAG: Npun_F5560 family protein [Leptolyngbyaceae cyanobacterium]